MLEINKIEFSYKGKKPTLKDISFTLDQGECLCLLGPNGTGKSTLLRCILQFLKPQKGDILVNGKDIQKLPAIKRARHLAYVSQSSDVTFPYRVYEVIQMGRTPYLNFGAPLSKNDLKIVHEVIEKLDLGHMEHAFFHELSGGEKQMVLIARALAQQADYLIMDEPTANLDYSNQIKILNMIKGLSKDGYGILMTSHFPDHGFLACNKALLMKEGLVMEYGEPEKVITSDSLSRLYHVPVAVATTEINNNKVIQIKKVCVPIM
ncbi:MAG TPA: ABC transporter ATP-binding protein [Candidatus Merdenecus merdavium]|nr:ABC transporter ATP-binding protein [Candidatus Merdenecus merdavium]